MNATEQQREEEIRFWDAQTDKFFEFLKTDGKFMAMLRSPNFTREEVEKEYNKVLRRYLRQMDNAKVKKLIQENNEMFLEEFKMMNIEHYQNHHPYEIDNDRNFNIAAEP